MNLIHLPQVKAQLVYTGVKSFVERFQPDVIQGDVPEPLCMEQTPNMTCSNSELHVGIPYPHLHAYSMHARSGAFAIGIGHMATHLWWPYTTQLPPQIQLACSAD